MYIDWVTKYNNGGTDGALTVNYQDAILMPFQDPPQAWMVKQSGFAGSAVIQPNFDNFEYGTDFAFFTLPSPDGNPAAMQVGGDFMGVFNNTSAVQALMTYLSSPEGASAWAKAGFDLTPNNTVNTDDYPDQLTKDKADALANAPDVSFDVGDALPAEVGQAEFDGITEAVGGGNVQDILNGIEDTYTQAMGMNSGM
jgi:alpha-glucoside transport system substrate-binding protein